MKKIMNFIAAAALLLADASCTKTVINDYVVPSVSSYDFDAEGGSFTIGIEASSASWDASGWDSWIEVEINKEEGTIVLTAQANDTGMPRETSVQLICGEASSEISLSQLYEGFKGNFTDMHEYGDKPVFSKNGRFYATYDVEYLSDGNTAVVIPIIVNAETGEKTVLEGSTEYKDMKAVNNDGTMISIMTSLASVVLKNGEPLSLEVSGYKNVNVEGFNGDGSIMVGYAQEAEGRKYVPIKWTDLTPEILPVPETNMNGLSLNNGAMARGCSEDGSVIYGSEWDTQGVIYWKDGQMTYIAQETAITRTVLISNMFTGELEESEKTAFLKKNAERYCISPNGRYIACTFYDYFTDESGESPSTNINYPAIIDTETGTAVLFGEAGFQKAMGMFASNDGVLFGNSTDSGDAKGYIFNIGSQSAVPVSEWLMSQYGIVTDDNRYIMNMSSDGKTLGGWRVESGATGTSYPGWYYIL